ncbi:MAG: rhodanese-like domain-containing protein [Methanomassiliicoccales archaeon]
MRTFGFLLLLLGLWIVFVIILYLAFGLMLPTLLLAAVSLVGIMSSSLLYRYYGWPYAERGKYVDITASELFKMINNGTHLQIIDVRTRREFRSGHIPSAKNISWTVIRRQTYLHGDLVIVSGTGRMSRVALRRVSADTLFNLREGYRGWVRAGYPIEK